MPSPSSTRPDVPMAWRLAHARGRRAHPRIELALEAFVAPPVGPVPSAVGDVYLARACDAGVDGAWERLEACYRKPVLRFLRRRGAARDEAELLLDDLWSTLATPPPRGGAHTRLGTYDGRGSLSSWLCTVAWRRLVDGWRARAGTREVEQDAPAPAGRQHDPALRASREEAARLIGLGLEDAWSEMTARELQVIVLKYKHRLPQKQIARVLRIGPPRVSRVLQSATTRLREAIARRFDRQSDWEVGGPGWDALLVTVERMLARADVDVDASAHGGQRGG